MRFDRGGILLLEAKGRSVPPFLAAKIVFFADKNDKYLIFFMILAAESEKMHIFVA